MATFVAIAYDGQAEICFSAMLCMSYLQKREVTMDKPGTYRIEVQGQLDASWSDRLGGMHITTDSSGKQGPMTILEGHLRDQAALPQVCSS